MLRPQERIDFPALKRGLRMLHGEVIFAAVSDSVMLGTLLTAFALHLGARPAQVGVLATIVFWAQLLQAPGVLLVERVRRRKLIAVTALLVSAAAPPALAALAFSGASQSARLALVGVVATYCGAGALGGCAWSAWTRDLIPRAVRGRFLAIRSRLAILATVVMGLLAAIALDLADDPRSRPPLFAALFGLACAARLLTALTLAQVPEPRMPPAPEAAEPLAQLLRRPLGDPKFRPLIRFSASWQFAVNLAQPFFTVFFLQQLGLSVTLVMALTIVSQLANGWAMKRWGPLVDRFGDKSVLNLAAPTYIACIAGMIGASQIGPTWLAAAYLIAIHVIMGVAGAGVSLSLGNIALKLSPKGAAAPYLSVNSLISSVFGGVAPILGGLGAEFFARRHVGLVVQWSGPLVRGHIVGLHLTGWHFYFVLSALFGLYALHLLAMVREDGALGGREMREVILARARARLARPPAAAGAALPEDLSQDLLADEPTEPAVAARPG